MSSDLKRLTETVNTAASDINRLEAILKEVSLIVRDLGGKMDLLLDARPPEVAQSQASPARKPIGRGKVTKPRRKTEPEEEPQADQQPAEEDDEKATPPPATVNVKQRSKAAVDEPVHKETINKETNAQKESKQSDDDTYTVKKPAVKAKPKPSKPAAFNKLTAFTQAYRANPKRFNEYFTKEVRDQIDSLPEVAGQTGDKLESARMRALYQTTIVNYPEIIDELRADFAKAQEAEDI
jgi:hypothetical protein